MGKEKDAPPAKPGKVVDLTTRLIEKKTNPPAATLYLEVNLQAGGAAKAMTGVFVPANYKPTPTVDVILYLHGNKTSRMGMDSTWTIETYWSHPAYHLREWLNDSGKQFILVAPTLGFKDQYGDLATAAEFHLDQIMWSLRQYGPHDKLSEDPKVGSIIIAGHSGGGSPMLDLAGSLGKYTDNIIEIWGFDTMYNPVEDSWYSWIKGHAGVKFYFYFVETERRSTTVAQKTADLDYIVITPGLASHDYLLQKHWKERVDCISYSYV